MKNRSPMLNFYFRCFLEVISFFPPFLARKILWVTGHWFRNWETNTSGIEPGALYAAMANMADAGVVPRPLAAKAAEDYLRYESRFVLENIWIRKNKNQNIYRSFNPSAVDSLKEAVGNEASVIICAHFPGAIPLVELLRIIGHEVSFVAVNALNQDLNNAVPIQRTMYELYSRWIDRQTFVFLDQGEIMEKCRASLKMGVSVFLAPDAPGYALRGAKIEMFKKKIVVPAGAAKLAADCSVPIWIVLPLARTCTETYTFLLEKIIPTGDITADTQQIFDWIEKGVRFNPVRWTGWLFFDKLRVSDEENAANH